MPCQLPHEIGPGRPVTRSVVQVAVPRPLRRVFDYALPAHLPGPKIGARVRVPFGRSEVVGIVTGWSETSVHRLKPVIAVLDDDGFLAPDLIALAQWLSGYYHHPLGEVYATLLPSAETQFGTAITPQFGTAITQFPSRKASRDHGIRRFVDDFCLGLPIRTSIKSVCRTPSERL